MLESTAISRELGARLRECRERAGLRTADVARKLEWPASKVSRLESGDRRCDPDDLAMFLGTCNVPQRIAKPLLKLAHDEDDGIWPRPHYSLKAAEKALVQVMAEASASIIVNFESCLIPGLLQTPGYTAAVMGGVLDVAPEDIPARVESRVARQKLLTRANPPQMLFFINEAVARCPVGGPKVMNEQLLHLVFMGTRPQTTIRVLPTSLGAHPGMHGSFMMVGYFDRRPVVLLEHEALSTVVEEREVVEKYRAIRAELGRIALDEDESRTLLADLASDYDRAVKEQDCHGGPEDLA